MQQYVDEQIYKKYSFPYKYETYEIYDKEEPIIDYYRAYYLAHNSENPIIEDTLTNSSQIMSVNRHVHILLNHFNISCDISQCGDGKTRESMAVLATYFFSLKYHKNYKLTTDKINICIFGPANCKNAWEIESKMNFSGVGKVKFFSINTIQGNKKNLPGKNFILEGKIENKKIVYYPGKLLKKLKENGFSFIFDEFHCSKNVCLSSSVITTITKYINDEGLICKYDEELIQRLNRKIEAGKIEKYSDMISSECLKNKIIFMSASLTDKKDITTILRALNIVDDKLIYGGRGIGSIKNYEQLKNFVILSRNLSQDKTSLIERTVLKSKRDIIKMSNEKIQNKYTNDLLVEFINELFTYTWIPLLFSHITPICENEFEPEIYNSFHKLKYGDKEILGLSKKLLKGVHNRDSSLKKFGSQIYSLELATIPILEGEARRILESEPNSRVILAVTKIVMVNILSKMLEDIEHIKINSEVANKNENIKNFQKNSSDSPRLIISTIKSIYQSRNLDDKNGKYRRYLLSVPTFSTIEQFQLVGRIFRRYTTKSKAVVKFIYVISSNVKNLDKDKLLNMTDYKQLDEKDPIQFSVILSNLNKSEYLERFIFISNNFLTKNMIFDFNDEAQYPINKKVYKRYIEIRNKEIS